MTSPTQPSAGRRKKEFRMLASIMINRLNSDAGHTLRRFYCLGKPPERSTANGPVAALGNSSDQHQQARRDWVEGAGALARPRDPPTGSAGSGFESLMAYHPPMSRRSRLTCGFVVLTRPNPSP